jgi:hypothetical protein
LQHTSLEAHVQTWVPASWARRLRELAEAGDRTLSAEVRRGLRAYLENDEAPAPQRALRETSTAGQGRHEPV